MLRSQAMVITQTLSLAKTMEAMAKGQLDVVSGITIMLPHILRLSAGILNLDKAMKAKITTQLMSIATDAKAAAGAIAHAIGEGVRQAAIWATVVAEKARAVAHAIANALSGPVGWAILAGAAVAAAVGIGIAMAIPSKQAGGPIEKTGPYYMHAGEYVLRPGERGNQAPTVNNFYIQNPVFRSRSDMDYLVDRLKRMGMA